MLSILCSLVAVMHIWYVPFGMPLMSFNVVLLAAYMKAVGNNTLVTPNMIVCPNM